MNQQIKNLQNIFGMLFGGATNAINSINPLHAQTALSPESLRPGQHGDPHAPYAVNGHPASPGWSILPQISAAQHPTIPMPHILGMPDYTVRPNPAVYNHPYVPVDGAFTRSNPSGFMPRGQFILPAQPRQYGRDFLNPGGPV